MDIEKTAKIFRFIKMASTLASNKKIDASVALSSLFDGRISTYEGFLHSPESLLRLHQKEIPLLQQREIVSFRNNNHSLTGYLYKTDLAKGLVLCVHGIKSMADDYNALFQEEFLKRGYDVLAIDLSCSGRSGGFSLPGLQQSAIDVKAAYDFILSREDLANLPLFFFGHSWGGYGVGASLAKGCLPLAVATVGAFASPFAEMSGLPKLYSFDSFPKEKEKELEEAAKQRDPLDYDLSASQAILGSKIPSLIIQGKEDKVVDLRISSLYGKLLPYQASHVKLSLYEEKGHVDILFSDKSNRYYSGIKELEKPFLKQWGKDLSKIPEDVLDDFTSSFHKEIASIPNKDLFDEVDRFYSSCLS